MTPIKEIIGKTLTAVNGGEIGSDCIEFCFDDGSNYRMIHHQDCCEQVQLMEIDGELRDLIGEPIKMAEESTNEDNPPEHHDEFLWTFYTLGNINDTITMRFLGESNGYYSVDVDFERIYP